MVDREGRERGRSGAIRLFRVIFLPRQRHVRARRQGHEHTIRIPPPPSESAVSYGGQRAGRRAGRMAGRSDGTGGSLFRVIFLPLRDGSRRADRATNTLSGYLSPGLGRSRSRAPHWWQFWWQLSHDRRRSRSKGIESLSGPTDGNKGGFGAKAWLFGLVLLAPDGPRPERRRHRPGLRLGERRAARLRERAYLYAAAMVAFGSR
jgi:hypothetical protein